MIQPDSRLNIQWIDAGIQLLVFLRSQMEAIDGYLEDFGFGQRGNVGVFDVHSGPGAREVNGWPRPTSSNDLAFSEYTNPQSAYPGVIPGLLYGSSSGCSPKNVSMYEPVCNNVLMAQHGSAPGDGNNYFSEAELESLEYSTMMTEQQAQHDQASTAAVPGSRELAEGGDRAWTNRSDFGRQGANHDRPQSLSIR
ncbi:hypothetical protein VTO58DRAFT_102634 [Aureobasidium pullulans]